jgi:hypothetical protein
MFTPDQERTAAELARVLRPGGRIGMVNWTPTSWVADLGEILGRYRPTSAPLPSPTRWGDRHGIDELLGPHASVQANERTFLFRFRSVAHHVDFLLEHYPPVVAVDSGLHGDDCDALRSDLYALAERRNIGPTDRLTVPMEYLEVVATRR